MFGGALDLRSQIREDTSVDPATLQAVNSAGGDVEDELARLEREFAAEQKRLDDEAAAAEAERQRLFDEGQAALNAGAADESKRLDAAAAAEAARRQAEIDALVGRGKSALETDLLTARSEIEAMIKRETDALNKLRADWQIKLGEIDKTNAGELARLTAMRDAEQAALERQLNSQRETQARIGAELKARQAEAAAQAERSARELSDMRAANELDLRNRRDEMQRTSAMRQVAAARAGRTAGARPLLAGADIGQATGAQTLGAAGSFANAGSLGAAGTLGAGGGLR